MVSLRVGSPVIAFAAGTLCLAQVTIHDIGTLPDSPVNNGCFSISDDGTAAACACHTSTGLQACRWTVEEGLELVGFLPIEPFFSSPRAISGDGSTVIGASAHLSFRWRAETGIQNLGDLPGGRYLSTAFGASYDGSVVVGVGNVFFNSQGAYRWSTQDGMEALALPDILTPLSVCWSVTPDGQMATGQVETEDGYFAARWTPDGLEVLVHPDAGGSSEGLEIIGDGSLIYGFSIGQQGWTLFRWRESDGYSMIPSLLYFVDASPDGKFVLAVDQGGAQVIWDEANGRRNVRDLIERIGYDAPPGWRLRYMAFDALAEGGRAMAGGGTIAPENVDRGFVITGIPSPGDIPGDFDGDSYVDARDMKAFHYCLNGPTGQSTGICEITDMDHDGDTDLRDFVEHVQPIAVEACMGLGDFSGDCDTDLNDYARIFICLNRGGPGVLSVAQCADTDLNQDGHHDLRDYAIFQAAYEDPDPPAR